MSNPDNGKRKGNYPTQNEQKLESVDFGGMVIFCDVRLRFSEISYDVIIPVDNSQGNT